MAPNSSCEVNTIRMFIGGEAAFVNYEATAASSEGIDSPYPKFSLPNRRAISALRLSIDGFQDLYGGTQIPRLMPFGESLVDGRKSRPCLRTATLLQEQMCQTGSRPKLPG